MRYFLIFILLLFGSLVLAVAPLPQRVSNHAAEESAATAKHNKENKKETTSPALVHNGDHAASPERNGGHETTKNEQGHVVVDRLPDKDKWDKIYIVLTAVLVLIGACSFGAVWYQAVQTKKATQAMEISTGVLMQVERGRIITLWDQLIHMDLSPTGVHDGTLSFCFNWSCANTGRTEAQLTSIWSRLVAVNKLSDLPEKPEYVVANERVYDGEPLQPDVKGRQTIWFSTPLENSLSFDEMEIKHRSGHCFLYAYGYARYRDVWDNPHVARFGVVRAITDSITTDYWLVAGPPAYNRSE